MNRINQTKPAPLSILQIRASVRDSVFPHFAFTHNIPLYKVILINKNKEFIALYHIAMHLGGFIK
jgi:hypothetical protein